MFSPWKPFPGPGDGAQQLVRHDLRCVRSFYVARFIPSMTPQLATESSTHVMCHVDRHMHQRPFRSKSHVPTRQKFVSKSSSLRWWLLLGALVIIKKERYLQTHEGGLNQKRLVDKVNKPSTIEGTSATLFS